MSRLVVLALLVAVQARASESWHAGYEDDEVEPTENRSEPLAPPPATVDTWRRLVSLPKPFVSPSEVEGENRGASSVLPWRWSTPVPEAPEPFGALSRPNTIEEYPMSKIGACTGITAFDIWYAATKESSGPPIPLAKVVRSVIDEVEKPGSQLVRPSHVEMDGRTLPLKDPKVVSEIASQVMLRLFPYVLSSKQGDTFPLPRKEFVDIMTGEQGFKKPRDLLDHLEKSQKLSAARAVSVALAAPGRGHTHSVSMRVESPGQLMVHDPNAYAGGFVPAFAVATVVHGVPTVEIRYRIVGPEGKPEDKIWHGAYKPVYPRIDRDGTIVDPALATLKVNKAERPR